MSRLIVFELFLLLALLSGCKEKQYQVVALPDSPDGRLNARAFILDETISIKISDTGKAIDFDPLVIGQCSGVKFFWTGPQQAALEYDSIQIAQFVSSPRYFSGASISLCDRSSAACKTPKSKVAILPGCDDASA